MYRENYSNTFGAVSRIRSIIIITFGSTNTVVYRDNIFGASTSVGSRDCDIDTVVLC